MDTEKQRASIRLKAMHLLATREHGKRELHDKLTRRFPDMQREIVEQLTALESEGLLCDRRFVESFVNARVGRGQGRLKIRMALKQRGVSGELIEEGLNDMDIDWVELARSVRVKRFGEQPVRDYQQRAKIGRYLQNRGFSGEEIKLCLG